MSDEEAAAAAAELGAGRGERRVRWPSDGEGGDAPAEVGEVAAGAAGGAARWALFVQLEELREDAAGGEAWYQTGRWIKYEQQRSSEDSGGRWSRARVGVLPLSALTAAQRALDAASLLLDHPAADLPAVAQCLSEALGGDDAALRARALLALAAPWESRRRCSVGARRRSSVVSHQSAGSGRRRLSLAWPLGAGAGGRKQSAGSGDEEGAGEEPAGGEAGEPALLRRVPPDARAALVLVAPGALPRARTALLRLARPLLCARTELPLPVRFVLALLGGGEGRWLRAQARAWCAMLADPQFAAAASSAQHRSELQLAADAFLDGALALPPGEWERADLLPFDHVRAQAAALRRRRRPSTPPERKPSLAPAAPAAPRQLQDDPLVRLGKPFGGLARDVRRRWAWFASDWRDALHPQVAAAALLMYFAALSAAVTFGGLLAAKTGGLIGAAETLLFTSVGGVLFALLSGQPLMIVGSTGPLLLLDEALAAFCRDTGVELLPARAAQGCWTLLLALLVAAAEGSVAARRITRFTEDIFSCLISLIFLSEPVSGMVAVFRANPLALEYPPPAPLSPANDTEPFLNGTSSMSLLPQPLPPSPNTALFSTMLALGTFALAWTLRGARDSAFLPRQIRRALADFAVPLAILVAVALAELAPVRLPRLQVPAGLSPSTARGWLVPLRLPLWAAAAMLAPALMLYIVLFLETHIAELIVSKPERRLLKGSGLHLDIVVLCAVNALGGAVGAPWLCVATVRSVAHVAALTKVSAVRAPGAAAEVLGAHEQRASALAVSLLLGLSVLAAPLLARVPQAALLGVFLHMGAASLPPLQLWQRTMMLLQPAKHHPPAVYVLRVPTRRMHLFTLAQLAALGALFAVKSSRLALLLPCCLVLCVPLRLLLARCFTRRQLCALDGSQREIDEDDDDSPKSLK